MQVPTDPMYVCVCVCVAAWSTESVLKSEFRRFESGRTHKKMVVGTCLKNKVSNE